MNKFSAGKQDLGGWSAKFGEETRNHRHPCKYSEGQIHDVFTFTWHGPSCMINLLMTRCVYW